MIPKKVRNVLDKYGITPFEFEENGSTKTVEDAAKSLNIAIGQVAKSILVKTSDEKFAMIITSGDKKLSSHKMKSYFGSKTSFANAEETMQLTGFYFGEVCPFGVDNVDILIDKSMKRFDALYI